MDKKIHITIIFIISIFLIISIANVFGGPELIQPIITSPIIITPTSITPLNCTHLYEAPKDDLLYSADGIIIVADVSEYADAKANIGNCYTANDCDAVLGTQTALKGNIAYIPRKIACAKLQEDIDNADDESKVKGKCIYWDIISCGCDTGYELKTTPLANMGSNDLEKFVSIDDENILWTARGLKDYESEFEVESYTYGDVRDIFYTAWKKGIVGLTEYEDKGKCNYISNKGEYAGKDCKYWGETENYQKCKELATTCGTGVCSEKDFVYIAETKKCYSKNVCTTYTNVESVSCNKNGKCLYTTKTQSTTLTGKCTPYADDPSCNSPPTSWLSEAVTSECIVSASSATDADYIENQLGTFWIGPGTGVGGDPDIYTTIGTAYQCDTGGVFTEKNNSLISLLQGTKSEEETGANWIFMLLSSYEAFPFDGMQPVLTEWVNTDCSASEECNSCNKKYDEDDCLACAETASEDGCYICEYCIEPYDTQFYIECNDYQNKCIDCAAKVINTALNSDACKNNAKKIEVTQKTPDNCYYRNDNMPIAYVAQCVSAEGETIADVDEYTKPICNDNNPCTNDYYDPTSEKSDAKGCLYLPKASIPCDNGTKICIKGECVENPSCTSDYGCNDTNPCTTDTCNWDIVKGGKKCNYTFKEDGTECITSVLKAGQCKEGLCEEIPYEFSVNIVDESTLQHIPNSTLNVECGYSLANAKITPKPPVKGDGFFTINVPETCYSGPNPFVLKIEGFAENYKSEVFEVKTKLELESSYVLYLTKKPIPKDCNPFYMNSEEGICNSDSDCPSPIGEYSPAFCLDPEKDGTKNCIYYLKGCLPEECFKGGDGSSTSTECPSCGDYTVKDELAKTILHPNEERNIDGKIVRFKGNGVVFVDTQKYMLLDGETLEGTHLVYSADEFGGVLQLPQCGYYQGNELVFISGIDTVNQDCTSNVCKEITKCPACGECDSENGCPNQCNAEQCTDIVCPDAEGFCQYPEGIQCVSCSDFTVTYDPQQEVCKYLKGTTEIFSSAPSESKQKCDETLVPFFEKGCVTDSDCPKCGNYEATCSIEGVCEYFDGATKYSTGKCPDQPLLKPGKLTTIPETHPLLVIALLLGILFILNRRKE